MNFWLMHIQKLDKKEEYILYILQIFWFKIFFFFYEKNHLHVVVKKSCILYSMIIEQIILKKCDLQNGFSAFWYLGG
jgi:hypothetical protein